MNMTYHEFLKLTLMDGFRICRLGNLKMFAENKTETYATEWAHELLPLEKDWNANDDYKRIIAAFREIKNTREDLGAFCIFLRHLENFPRSSQAVTPMITQQSTFTDAQIAENRRKIASAINDALKPMTPSVRFDVKACIKDLYKMFGGAR